MVKYRNEINISERVQSAVIQNYDFPQTMFFDNEFWQYIGKI